MALHRKLYLFSSSSLSNKCCNQTDEDNAVEEAKHWANKN